MNEHESLLNPPPEAAYPRQVGEIPLLGLDWDGVLNFGPTWGRGLSADKLDMVAEIWRACGECEIRIISQRRYDSECRQVIEGLIERGVGHPALIGLLPAHVVIDGEMQLLKPLDRTALERQHGQDIRAGTIADWAALLGAEPRRSWVVIDDRPDPWRVAGLERRVWAPDPQRGLTLPEAGRVVAMLKDPALRGNVQPLKAEEGEGRQECHPSLAPTVAEGLGTSKMRQQEGGLV